MSSPGSPDGILPLYSSLPAKGRQHPSRPSLLSSSTSQVTLTRKRKPTKHLHHRSNSFNSPFSPQRAAAALFSPSTWSALLSSPSQILSPAFLTQRARTTNLAVILLLLTLTCSILGNIRFYLHEHPLKGERDRLPFSIRATLPQSSVLVPPPALPATNALLDPSVNVPVNLAQLDHLILVPGHAVWKGRSKNEAWSDDNWILEPIQKGGSIKTYVKHIMKGVDEALSDPSSLLIFSGGQTRPYAYETEGDSYFRLAQVLNLPSLLSQRSKNGLALDTLTESNLRKMATDLSLEGFANLQKRDEIVLARDDPTFQDAVDTVTLSQRDVVHQGGNGHGQQPENGVLPAHNSASTETTSPAAAGDDVEINLPPFPRAATEQFALDSFQNLLFSICRFKEITGHYPTKITVVGYGMKRSRFTDVHRKALRWPEKHFRYIGIDDEGETGQSYLGELTNGLQPYTLDLYGCKAPLINKRRSRNPFRRIHPYFTSNPELKSLLEYCPPGGSEVWSGHLPWEEHKFMGANVGLIGDR